LHPVRNQRPMARVHSLHVRVLLVGSGGREHALAWKLCQSSELEQLHAAPGNPGIAALGPCHPVRAEDGEGLLDLAGAVDADLVVVGPEAPLVAGVADELRHAGVAVVGPGAAAARIEGSKRFAKEVMRSAGVPTAEALAVARPPCVVKADGLTAGKGVFVCRTQTELEAGLRAATAFGEAFVVEELLEGEELSVFALTDGSTTVVLGAAQDYKRVGDGDTGPNTGGMGSYSPVAGFGPDEVEELVATVHRPVLDELARRGTPFVGCLYAGLMLTEDGPRVLEFNCRLGDPETQCLLPALDGDFLELCWRAATGGLESTAPTSSGAAVTVVLAAGNYPAEGDSGSPIEGVEAAEALGALVFHAGTAVHGETLVTNGGRVLNVTGRADSVPEARELAYAAAECLSFTGMRYRRDVAAEADRVRG
jgi:phosphoribosylamine--glycine ligase